MSQGRAQRGPRLDAVESVVRLDDGRIIELTGRPPQGTRHRVLFGRDRGGGVDVVLKIELVRGALENERRALHWLTAAQAPAPAPQLLGAARVVRGDGHGARCLILEHVAGGRPDGVGGWTRLGRSLSALTTLSCRQAGLPIHDVDGFGRAHVARVRDLEHDLGPALTDAAEWGRLGSAEMPAPGPLVLTHGDPGPGNFLDDGRAGTLIDWEDAHVAPRGLDLARALFIALLGAGPEGFVAADQAACASAVVTGYLDGLGGRWTPSRRECRWWLTVAGFQFAHRRWQRRGQPGVLPWRDAIAVLAVALGDAGPGGWT